MSNWPNGKLIKCPFDEIAAVKMPSWWNGRLIKWQVDKMHAYEMESSSW